MALAAGMAVAAPAFAAAEDDIEKALEETATPAPQVQETEEALPEIGEDKLQDFVLERGLYFSGDLGVFQTIGGVKGVSNLQPYMGIRAGYDINNFLSLQAALSTAYVSGNPASPNDEPGAGGNETVNYGLLGVGVEVVGAIRPTTRFAIEPKVGGGMTFVNPEITDRNDPRSSLGSKTPHVVGGLDFKYLTLLTDFTAGIALNAYYLITPAVVGFSEAFVVRYTF